MTKFVWLNAVKNTKVEPVVKMLKELFVVFGVPKRLICDRGTAFTSKIFQKLCLDNAIKLVQNASATPRANGQVERYNRTILAALKTSIESEVKWDKSIPQIRWSCNNVANDTTGYSAYQLMFGLHGRGMNDAAIVAHLFEKPRLDAAQIREKASDRIKETQRKAKARYDRNRVSRKFKSGDLVLVKRKIVTNDGCSKKLLPKYAGPYRVEVVLGNDRYVIVDIEGAQRTQKSYKGVHPVDHLKSYSNQDLSDISDNTTDEN